MPNSAFFTHTFSRPPLFSPARAEAGLKAKGVPLLCACRTLELPIGTKTRLPKYNPKHVSSVRTDVVVCSHTPRFDLPCQQSPNQRHSTANRFSKPSEIQDIRRTDRNLSTLSPIRRPRLGRVQPCATTVYRNMFSTSSIALAFLFHRIGKMF